MAHRRHDKRVREAAKGVLAYPEVMFTGRQAASVGGGFADQVRKSGYVIHACAILPDHVHLVILRHRYAIEQVVRLLRQAATKRLLEDGLHPFANMRNKRGRLPSVWAQDFWKVFLYNESDIARSVQYATDNPLKEGKPRQKWSFVTPFTG